MIVIVDYGMGNLRSVQKVFERLGHASAISADPARIASADKLILPGVGHFARGMENLKDLVPLLTERVLEGRVPVLGICLGYQLISSWSEEGDVRGLGWIAGRTVRIPPGSAAGLRVPHMGWNTVEVTRPVPLFAGITDGSFYFAHSFHVKWAEPADVVGVTSYGSLLSAAVHRGNIWAVQFHPEKSLSAGMSLLKNFAALRELG